MALKYSRNCGSRVADYQVIAFEVASAETRPPYDVGQIEIKRESLAFYLSWTVK